jgi:hypothetical protein
MHVHKHEKEHCRILPPTNTDLAPCAIKLALMVAHPREVLPPTLYKHAAKISIGQDIDQM